MNVRCLAVSLVLSSLALACTTPSANSETGRESAPTSRPPPRAKSELFGAPPANRRDVAAVVPVDEPVDVPAPASPAPVALTPDPQAGKRHHAFDAPKRYTKSWNAPERDAYQKPTEIIAAMRIAPGQTVADLGAGTGYLLPHLARAVGPQGRVLAVDVEPAMIEYLQEAAKREPWSNVEPVLADLDRTNLEADSVDRLVTLNTWHHIEDRVAYAERLAGAMAPGGEALVVDFIPEETPGFGPPLKMRLSADRVAEEFRAAGWETEILEETLPRHYIVRARRRP